MINRATYIIILLFLHVSLYAAEQFECGIKGRVVDAVSSVPFEGAKCVLEEEGRIINTLYSDTDGLFNFQIASDELVDSISVNIDAIDYEPYHITLYNHKSPVDLGDCFLIKTTTLDELEVNASPVVNSNGKMIITPMKSQLDISSHAIDLLGNLAIPGLVYNPSNRTIAIASRNPVIFINGVQSSQDQLKSIAASDVVSVEYSSSVPPIYSRLGDCMINVRLKKKSAGGNLNVYESNDFIGSIVANGIDLGYNQGPSRFHANFSFLLESHHKTYDTIIDKFFTPQKEVTVSQQAESPFTNRNYNGLLEYVYNPGNSIIFMARASISAVNYLYKSHSDINDTQLGMYESQRRSSLKKMNPTVDLYFSKTFNSSSTLDINIVGNHSDTDYNSVTDYQGISTEITPYILNSRRYSLISAASYSHMVSSGITLGLTYTNTLSWNRNKYQALNSVHRMRETNNSAVISYRQSAGPVWISLETGLNQKHVTENGRSNNFIGNTTTANINWNISSKWNLGYYGTFSPGQLSLSDLIDSPIEKTNYLFITGTPDLKTPLNLKNSVTATFISGRLRVNTILQDSRIFHPVLFRIDYMTSADAFLKSMANGTHLTSQSIAVGGGYYGWLNMFYLQGAMTFRHSRVAMDDWKKVYNQLSGWVQLDWNYKKWTVTYQRQFPEKVLDGFSFFTQPSYDTLSLTFKPDKHWILRLGWEHMFDRRGWHYNSRTISPNYEGYEAREMHDCANMIRLMVVYDLSFGDIFKTTRQKNMNLQDTQTTFRRIDN